MEFHILTEKTTVARTTRWRTIWYNRFNLENIYCMDYVKNVRLKKKILESGLSFAASSQKKNRAT